jgi:hypothetical protein
MAPGAPAQLVDLLNRAVAREVSQRPQRPSDLFLQLRNIELVMGWPPTDYRTFDRGGSLSPGVGAITEVPGAPATPAGPVASGGPVFAAPPAPAAGVYIERPSHAAATPGGGPTATELHTRTTTPGDPAPAARPVPTPAPGQAPDDEDEAPPATRRSPGRIIGIGVGVIAALALVGWGASFLLTDATPTATPSHGAPATSAPVTPQTVFRPLPVATITAAREGGGVRFSWTYSDVQDGDWFRVVRTDVVDPAPSEVTEPNIFIDDPSPCIEVQIIRRNGQAGPPQRDCFP